MYINIKSHNTSKGYSSYGVVEYLEKENKENELSLSKEQDKKNESVKNLEEEYFFNNEYDPINSNQKITKNQVINSLDNNRGSKRNIKEPNFYMVNISPSYSELKHMENIADLELQRRKIDKKNELIYQEQKEQLIKMQLKLYVKDVMKEYAKNFDRDIPVNEKDYPKGSDKKKIDLEVEEKFKEFLKDKEITSPDKINEKNKTSKFIEVDNLKIKGEKSNSYLVNVDLGYDMKADVFIPKKMMYEQIDGKFKITSDLYLEKEKEAINKNTTIEIKNSSIKSTNELKNGEKVLNINIEDERFKNGINLSLKESDINIIDGKIFTNKHLLDLKYKKAFENSINENYGYKRKEFFNQIAKEKGFNPSTRKINENDLMWYGKIEKERTYKFDDKIVLHNKEVRKNISKLDPIKDKEKIKEIEKNYKRDKNNTIIVEGLKKQGLNYHAHILVSRHDKTMINKENKISLSPNSNHRKGNMPNGQKVGFDRHNFYESSEKLFDEKFEYQRKDNEKYYNLNFAKHKVKGKAKSFIYKHTGLSDIKRELSPISKIKSQIGISNIPTSLPKNKVELAYKIAKKIIEKGIIH